jgi:RNA-directed DNA polymerase
VKYKEIATKLLEGELKLTVNKEKTHITDVHKGIAYLGFIIYSKYVTIHPKKIKAIKDKIRQLTPRTHGMNVEQMIKRLNPILRGWANYFRIANCKNVLAQLMGWIRRRLRAKKMKEWKTWKKLHKALRRRGYNGEFEKISMTRWRNSASPLISMALPNSWFDEIGLINLIKYNVGILHHFR